MAGAEMRDSWTWDPLTKLRACTGQQEEESGVGTPPGTSINSPHSHLGFSIRRVPKLARLGHGCSDLPWLSTSSGLQPALPFQTRRFLPHRTWSSAEDGACIRDLRGSSSCSESMGQIDSQAATPGSGLQTQGRCLGILPAPFTRQGPHGPCVCQLRPPSQCPGLAQPWLSPRLGVPGSCSAGAPPPKPHLSPEYLSWPPGGLCGAQLYRPS